jgi:hypothetical protein
VVDRFHLVQNLRQAWEAVLLDRRLALQDAAVSRAMALLPTASPVPVTPKYRGQRRSPKPAPQDEAARPQTTFSTVMRDGTADRCRRRRGELSRLPRVDLPAAAFSRIRRAAGTRACVALRLRRHPSASKGPRRFVPGVRFMPEAFTPYRGLKGGRTTSLRTYGCGNQGCHGGRGQEWGRRGCRTKGNGDRMASGLR